MRPVLSGQGREERVCEQFITLSAAAGRHLSDSMSLSSSMNDLDEIKSKLAMASSGLRKTLDNAEDLDEVDDEALAAIENARESVRSALERIDNEK